MMPSPFSLPLLSFSRLLVTAMILSLLWGPETCAAEPSPGSPWRVVLGPLVRHHAPDRVIVHFETSHPFPSVLEYGAEGVAAGRTEVAESNKPTYAVVLEDLKPGQEYWLKIKARDEEAPERVLADCRFDTSCDLRPLDAAEAPSPYPRDELTAICAKAARQIVDDSGVDRGYCLVLGCGEGRLALELARLSDLQIVGVEEDPAKVHAARKFLDAAGVYGVRVVVHHAKLDKLPYADHLANLVVCERTLHTGELPPSMAEVCRVLRPCGGVAWLGQMDSGEKQGGRLTLTTLETWLESSPLAGWTIERRGGLRAVLRRGPLPGAGRWTHQYADAENSACSNDRLRAPLEIQWFGRPGPRLIVDRHNRSMAPLMTDGRLFVIGNDRIKAVDAYNGAPLWDWTVPHSRRTAVTRNCGQAVATEDTLYVVAHDKCLALDAATGRLVRTFAVPQPEAGQPSHWGYVAVVGELLFGTASPPGASFDGLSEDSWKPGYLDNQPTVTGNRLFCMDRHTGELLWTHHDPEGIAIAHTAIAIGAGRVFFIGSLESRRRPAVVRGAGRLPLQVLLAQGTGRLVALDQRTGKVVWRRAVDLSMLRHAVYLSLARHTVLITGSFNQDGHPRYELTALNAADGSHMWSTHYVRTDKATGGDHGEQEQHPVIVGGVIYTRPRAFDLATGQRLPFDLADGGCGTISASAGYIFGRRRNPHLYEITAGGRSTPITTVTRPGCWINIIAAGGLLLIPEGSSGCSCAFPVQTSMALAPQAPSTVGQGLP